MVMPTASAPVPSTRIWQALTIVFAIVAILSTVPQHEHEIKAHTHNSKIWVPTPSSGKWAPTHGDNAELSEQGGKFLARGKIHYSETLFVKAGECDVAYATDSRGRVWELKEGLGESARIIAHVGGTLLGGGVDEKGGIYVADSTRGLIYIERNSEGKFEAPRLVSTLAPSLLELAKEESDLDASEIRYCNDIAIDYRTGYVYFTDSTRIAPSVSTNRRGDTFDSYSSSQMSGDATGRLLVYNPDNGVTNVMVVGIPFANGVGVSEDGKHVVFASTSSYSIRMVPIYNNNYESPVQFDDTAQFFDGKLPGLPDGVTVDRRNGDVYVAVFGPLLPILRLIDHSPQFVRRFALALPKWCRPKPSSVYTMIVIFDRFGKLKKVLHDTKRIYGLLTSVERCNDYLYCGALKGHFGARFLVRN